MEKKLGRWEGAESPVSESERLIWSLGKRWKRNKRMKTRMRWRRRKRSKTRRRRKRQKSIKR